MREGESLPLKKDSDYYFFLTFVLSAGRFVINMRTFFQVLYVDFGHTNTIPGQKILECPPALQDEEFTTIPCVLQGCENMPIGMQDPQVNNILDSCKDKEITVNIVGKKDWRNIIEILEV